VSAEPDAPPAHGGANLLIVCGSTYSIVQGAIREKARAIAPEAEFFAIRF